MSTPEQNGSTAQVDQLLRISDVARVIGRSESTIRRDVKAGRFPPPVRIGARGVAWKASDITQFFAELERVSTDECQL